ncbi:MAG: PilN domain-containing protein, partial [Candidatus Omnitrophica bacterium]|nr:PilN domain-containing protein [Candidatus Omnitrophota bacterium]
DESQVRGGTFGNEWISKFIDNLNGSHYFKNAAFARTEAGKLNDRSVVNFELVFELVQQSG